MEQGKGFRLKDTVLIVALAALIGSAVPINPQAYKPLNPKPVVETLLGQPIKPEPVPEKTEEKPVKVDPYADWTVYTNETAKIRLRLPPGWNAAERLPKPGADTGQYLTLTISAVDQDQRQANPSPFANMLGLFLTFDTQESVESSTHELFGKLGPSDTIMERLKINGAEYSLIGVRRNGLPGGEVIQVEMMQCLVSGQCSWHIKRASGSYLDATIASQGNDRQNRYAVDLNSDDYAKIKKILESLKF